MNLGTPSAYMHAPDMKRQNAKLVFDDTVRFCMYALGMAVVERLRTGHNNWTEKAWMVSAGFVGSALFHSWFKQHLHSSVLFPDHPPQQPHGMTYKRL